jgi:hypothetical protein
MPIGAGRLVPRAALMVAAVGQPTGATVVVTPSGVPGVGVGALLTPTVGMLGGVVGLVGLVGDALELPQAQTAALTASIVSANRRMLPVDTRDASRAREPRRGWAETTHRPTARHRYITHAAPF